MSSSFWADLFEMFSSLVFKIGWENGMPALTAFCEGDGSLLLLDTPAVIIKQGHLPLSSLRVCADGSSLM